jgi:hypothetical protein
MDARPAGGPGWRWPQGAQPTGHALSEKAEIAPPPRSFG